MTITEISETIINIGLMTTISVLFLYMVITLFNLFIQWLKNRNSIKSHDEGIKKRFEVDVKIHALLRDFQQCHNCQRVHVVEFSNSVMSVAYLPFRYMNCTYEAHDLDVKYTAKFIDKLSTSLFSTFFVRLRDEDTLQLDTENPDPTLGGAVYDVMINSGERYGLYCLITYKDKPIGYVAMRSEDPFTNEDSEDLEELAAKLLILLTVCEK